MNLKIISALTLSFFPLFTTNALSAETSSQQSPTTVDFTAVGGPAKTITLGSIDPNTGFRFLLELTSRGAAISKATLSEFDDRNRENPQALVLLSPAARPDGSQVFSMANQSLVFPESKLQLPLAKLDWNVSDVITDVGLEAASFEAIIKDKATGEPVIKLTKTYTVKTDAYHVDCNLTIENLSPTQQGICFDLTGPAGIGREDVGREDRKALAGLRDTSGQINGIRANISDFDARKKIDEIVLNQPNTQFLWTAITSKYFTAILVPLPHQDKAFCDWVNGRRNKEGDRQIISKERRGLRFAILRFFTGKSYKEEVENTGKVALFFNPAPQEGPKNQKIATALSIDFFTLSPQGQTGASRQYDFLLYLGPKDKGLFDKNPLYKNLGFLHTIDFMPCFCCPSAIIQPLAFGILWLMKWLHGFWPHNYGIVIIILVLLVRLILHPLTKKGQVSMSEYSKFQSLPEVQEIRKKYSKDIMEMNRRIAEVQKKHGLSHSMMLMGMLPTLVQMPIWIALYSAIYASIDLRGAGFLPVWITDLSAPDALFRFPGGFTLPILGDTFNLLPILMGIAFYLQQKLMPSQATATTPEAAQQQKIMMFMMPVLFPFMLYTSPSGLNLYIMASVFGGVIEQYVIKKHIREKEQQKEQGLVAVTSKTGGKIKKKKPKPFFKI